VLGLLDLVDDRHRQVFQRDSGRSLRAHQHLVAADAECAGALARFEEDGRRYERPVQSRFPLQEIQCLSRPARAPFVLGGKVRRIDQLHARRHFQAAGTADHQQALHAGPLHAGTWRPQQLDNTFGPRAVYANGCSADQDENLAPCFGLQFFGHASIDGATGVMTVTLKDVDNRDLWSIGLEPKTHKWSAGSTEIRG